MKQLGYYEVNPISDRPKPECKPKPKQLKFWFDWAETET
jgi:hypothetical protein